MSGWLSNFVKALSDPFKPDVFMYLAANQTSMDNVTNKFTAHDLDLAISRLDPIVVEFERTEPPASSHFTTKCTTSSGKGPVCSTGAEQVCAYHGQMDKVARSFELAKRHEQRFGFRYEYFTRLRPDVYFEPLPSEILAYMRQTPAADSPLRVPLIDVTQLNEDLVTDQFAIVPQQFAHAYFSAREAVNLCAPLFQLWKTAPEDWVPGYAVDPPTGPEPAGAFGTPVSDALAADPDDLPDPLLNFFWQLKTNNASYAQVSGLVHNEVILTYWLRTWQRVPLLRPNQNMPRVKLIRVREDGERLPSNVMSV